MTAASLPKGPSATTLPPAGCVWDVAWLADGDLVTACADYVARVWTTKEERAASAETVAGLAAALEARQQPQQGQQADGAAGAGLPPGLKMEEASALVQPGKKDGEIKVINEGGAGIAYSWDAARCAQLHRVPWQGAVLVSIRLC